MYNGEMIKKVLNQKGLRQKDIMNALGWKNTNQFRQVVMGNPRADILEAICDYLNIPIDLLFGRVGDSTGHIIEKTTSDKQDQIVKIQSKIIEKQKEQIDLLHELLKAKENL